MAQANNISLRFDQVSKTFEEGTDRRTVLNHVTGAFNDGEYVALLGKSGSGKSTLLNLISGIDEPSAGNIHLGNICISSLGERERTLFRRDHIGFVFQFFNLISTLTVLENVTLPLELAGMHRRKAGEYAMVLLKRVGLGNRRGSFPDRLSGGEQQRVAIARALVNNPSLILADEPTGNLDEDTGRHIIDLLLELSRNSGKSLIVATHSPEIAGQADRVFRIHEGRLLETGVNKK